MGGNSARSEDRYARRISEFQKSYHTTAQSGVRKSIHTGPQHVLQELLRQIRREAGLTQKELAARLDTPHSRISDYERGERRLDLVQLMAYCQALGVDLRVIVDRFLTLCEQEDNSSPQSSADQANNA